MLVTMAIACGLGLLMYSTLSSGETELIKAAIAKHAREVPQ